MCRDTPVEKHCDIEYNQAIYNGTINAPTNRVRPYNPHQRFNNKTFNQTASYVKYPAEQSSSFNQPNIYSVNQVSDILRKIQGSFEALLQKSSQTVQNQTVPNQQFSNVNFPNTYHEGPRTGYPNSYPSNLPQPSGPSFPLDLAKNAHPTAPNQHPL